MGNLPVNWPKLLGPFQNGFMCDRYTDTEVHLLKKFTIMNDVKRFREQTIKSS